MALSFKIGKSAYDKLSDDVKKEYKQTGDDYQLDLDGYEDPAELRRARDREKDEAANAKRELAAEKKAREKADQKIADLEKAGGSVDDAVNAARKELEDKYGTELTAANDKYSKLVQSMVNGRRTAIAEGLANKVSTHPHLLKRDIADRVDVEYDEKTGTVKEYVLGKDGKRSASTLEDLEKEVLQNKDYAPILRGTQAKGGGGAPPNAGGGGAPRSNNPPRPGTPPNDLTKMSPQELVAYVKAQGDNAGA